MKREVDSTLVEKGVAERVRLTAMYTRKQDELQRQHEAVKHGLEEHRAKVCILEQFLFSSRVTNEFLSHRPKRCSRRRQNLMRVYRKPFWRISTPAPVQPAAHRWERCRRLRFPVETCAPVLVGPLQSPFPPPRTHTKTTLTILTYILRSKHRFDLVIISVKSYSSASNLLVWETET